MLRKAVASDVVNSLWQQARKGQESTNARCPSCLRAMHEAHLSLGPGVQTIDACTRCHLVWFDPGEYRDLEDYAAATPETERSAAPKAPLTPEMAEALARFQLEHARTVSSHRSPVGAGAGTEPPDAWWKYLPGLLGMPVEFDAVPLSRRPWVTYALVVVVSLVSMLAFKSLETTAGRFGFVPADGLRMLGLTTLTPFFLHGGWMHLIGNMYFLVVFGDNVEDVLGHARMGLLLLLATLAGNLLHAAITAQPELPCIGASGGISGVIAFYALRFPRVRLGFLWFYVSWVRIPAALAFVFWVGLQIWGASSDWSSVAYGAHLGGAVVGLVFWFALRE
jgi:membrane associated rhomboid family serine protease/Zn-finger nucleic acid-binding protein